MDSISNRIKLAMEQQGLKQSELVEKTGISKGALSSYISGRYIPKQKNIYLLSHALSVSEAWLMGLDVPMERSTLSDINKNDDVYLVVDEHEKTLIESYRSSDEDTKRMVDRLLAYARAMNKDNNS